MDLCRDLNRSWVKKLIPNLNISLQEMFSSMGYTGYSLIDMWYHQYSEGDTYGWHYHGLQYAGIYYLEFPKGSAKTEIRSPYSLRDKKVDTSEGDIIIFPAHWIHRAPPNTSVRKTIISFNFDLIVPPETK